ncbi:MAG: glycosyltransferase [Pseudomonadota bacterium]|nr:glycosyltransferase [Pseudomonadota bacterium]
MRVLHVTPCYPPTWAYGGIPRAVHGLARAQVRAGLDVRVWTTDVYDATRRAPVPARHHLDGVEVVVSRVASNRLAWSHQLYLPMGTPPLADVDVVHLHAHRNLLNVQAFRGARAAGLPVVLTPHGTLPRIERKVGLKRLWDALFDGHVPASADRVIATSRAEVRQVLAAGVHGDRVARIPNGLWLEEFDELPPRGTFRAAHGLGDAPIVAYLGQITPRKGVDTLVRAFAGAAMGDARLVLAGPARGMDVPGGVFHAGTLEGPDRLALLVDADVLAYPSTHEVFGLVPLEGLMCGAPVVVGGDCGCGELIGEAGAGLLVAGGDVEALRGALRTLLSDRDAARGMVERGRRYIARHLGYAEVAAAHQRVYDAVRA